MHSFNRLVVAMLTVSALTARAGDFEWSDLGLRIGVDVEPCSS